MSIRLLGMLQVIWCLKILNTVTLRWFWKMLVLIAVFKQKTQISFLFQSMIHSLETQVSQKFNQTAHQKEFSETFKTMSLLSLHKVVHLLPHSNRKVGMNKMHLKRHIPSQHLVTLLDSFSLTWQASNQQSYLSVDFISDLFNLLDQN